VKVGQNSNRFDYVVVGAGAAGCALAARLSEDPDCTVLLVEAGSDKGPAQADIPLAAAQMLGTEHDWAFETEPEASLAGRRIPLAHGRILGGSTAINSMVYLRGSRSDYDDWGTPGWTYSEVLPYFRRCEDNSRGPDAFHGIGGPVSVSDLRYKHELTSALLAAASSAGHALNPDMNGSAQDGFGFVQVTQRDGRRVDANTAYLAPVRSRANLTVLHGTQVLGVNMSGTRAVGVNVLADGSPETILADDVILSAGTYHSPQILIASGIGPAGDLKALGIPVVQDLPVGHGLQDHLRVGLILATSRPSLRSMWTDEAQEEFLSLGTGPLTSNVGEAAGFLKTNAAVSEPDFQVSLAAAAVAEMLGAGGHGMTIGGWVSKPTSRGKVSLRSSDPLEVPRIVHNYLSTSFDRGTMCAGVRHMLEIAGQSSLGEFTEQGGDRPQAEDDASILEWVARVATTAHHPTSTCAIGSVVDASLKVQGLDRLRVVDASVIPSVPRANTMATALMVGERAADLIRKGAADEISL
jgi:choline dehydrogenase